MVTLTLTDLKALAKTLKNKFKDRQMPIFFHAQIPAKTSLVNKIYYNPYKNLVLKATLAVLPVWLYLV